MRTVAPISAILDELEAACAGRRDLIAAALARLSALALTLDAPAAPKPKAEPETTISIKEAARRLGVTRGFIQARLDRHQIPSIRRGRRRLVDAAAINRWIGKSMP